MARRTSTTTVSEPDLTQPKPELTDMEFPVQDAEKIPTAHLRKVPELHRWEMRITPTHTFYIAPDGRYLLTLFGDTFCWCWLNGPSAFDRPDLTCGDGGDRILASGALGDLADYLGLLGELAVMTTAPEEFPATDETEETDEAEEINDTEEPDDED